LEGGFQGVAGDVGVFFKGGLGTFDLETALEVGRDATSERVA
jgi:hypothetical protein